MADLRVTENVLEAGWLHTRAKQELLFRRTVKILSDSNLVSILHSNIRSMEIFFTHDLSSFFTISHHLCCVEVVLHLLFIGNILHLLFI